MLRYDGALPAFGTPAAPAVTECAPRFKVDPSWPRQLAKNALSGGFRGGLYIVVAH